MRDAGWMIMGMKFNWWIVMVFIIAIILLLYFVVRPREPHKHVDKRAGDEGQD